MAVNLGTYIPEWKTATSEDKLFDADLIFDFEAFRTGKNCHRILKEEENVDEHGNYGQYYMKEDFQIILIYGY